MGNVGNNSGRKGLFEVFETLICAPTPRHLRAMMMEERIARQIDASIIFAMGNFTFAIVLAIAFSPVLHPLFVWGWCAVTVSLSGLQLLQWYRKRKSSRRSHSTRTVASIVNRNLIVASIWGLFGAVAGMQGTAESDVLLIALLSVTVAGGVLLNTMIPLAAVLVFLCAGITTIIAISIKHPGLAAYMVLLVPVLLVLIVFVARHNFMTGIQFVQREYELLATMMKLENATRKKSAFVASTSHELRTPLNAIIGFSEIIRDEIFGVVSPPRYGEYVKHIHGSALHLMGVINDLLDLSRIETGNAEIRMEWVGLPQLLNGATAMVASLAEGRGITVRPLVIEGEPRILTDKQRFTQVLLNLLSNAIKYSESGAGVQISVAPIGAGDLAVTITDEGLGMTPSEVRQALTPFGRTESSTTTGEQGTGLGLPITRHLLQVLDGDLQIDSVKGQGTSVRIVLPADAWLATDSTARPDDPALAPVENHASGGMI